MKYTHFLFSSIILFFTLASLHAQLTNKDKQNILRFIKIDIKTDIKRKKIEKNAKSITAEIAKFNDTQLTPTHLIGHFGLTMDYYNAIIELEKEKGAKFEITAAVDKIILNNEKIKKALKELINNNSKEYQQYHNAIMSLELEEKTFIQNFHILFSTLVDSSKKGLTEVFEFLKSNYINEFQDLLKSHV